MPTLRRRHAGVIEDEFTVTGQELGLAFEYGGGLISRRQAVAKLEDWRWSTEDANLFLDLITQLRGVRP